MVLVAAQQWEQAEMVAVTIKQSEIKTEVLKELAVALVTGQSSGSWQINLKRFEIAIHEIENNVNKLACIKINTT